jgi:hypothetical protein
MARVERDLRRAAKFRNGPMPRYWRQYPVIIPIKPPTDGFSLFLYNIFFKIFLRSGAKISQGLMSFIYRYETIACYQNETICSTSAG